MKSSVSSFVLIVSFFRCLRGQDCPPSQTTAKGALVPERICSGALIFEDNFDSLDEEKWLLENTMSGGGNEEFQWYTTSKNNTYTKDGWLHIRTTFVSDIYGNDFLYSGTIDLGDKCTDSFSNGCKKTGNQEIILNPIESGKLTTKNSFSFKYGVLEARARVPIGDWLWPAIWMLPIDNKYGGWPASGEIDMVESIGNKDMLNSKGEYQGTRLVFSTMHWGPNPNFNRWHHTHWDKYDPSGFHNDFHIYQVRWTPDIISFSVDGSEIGNVSPPAGGFWKLGNLEESGLPNPWPTKMAPFDKEYYIILNLAVGGSNGYFPDEGIYYNPPKPWKNGDPHAVTDFWQAKQSWEPSWNKDDPNSHQSHFEIDYVRVYAL